MLWASLGENCLADDVLKRHGLNFLSTPFASCRSNIGQILQADALNYENFLDKQYLEYGITTYGAKVVKNVLFCDDSDIFMHNDGFEFTHHDVIENQEHVESMHRKVNRMIDLKNDPQDIVFLYHHRRTKNTDLDKIVENLNKFVSNYSSPSTVSKIALFYQRIVEDDSLRRLEVLPANGNVMPFLFHTRQKWQGADGKVLFGKVDDDLMTEMFQSIHARISEEKRRQKYKLKYQEYIEKNGHPTDINSFCNICGYSFFEFEAYRSRVNAVCPVCGSIERQRHLFFHLLSLFPFLKGKKMLHFAPEVVIKEVLQGSGVEYYDADLKPGRATPQVDITNISFPDNYFDFILAVHVLEHIEADRSAMADMFRVLKPGGLAVLAVPLTSRALEEPGIKSPEDRLRIFKHPEHVRNYDFKMFHDRLGEAGFQVTVSDCAAFPAWYRDGYRISNMFFFARKPV